jgi:phosphoglycerol transferase MdoB-like AlkP superfamily enzyme
VIFSIARAFILFFVVHWQETSTTDIFNVLFTGLRFDLKVSAVCIILFSLLPTLPMSLLNRWHWLGNISRYSLLFILLISLFFSFLDIGFFFYFGTAISNLMFGIVDDGTSAVMISILADWRLDIIIILAIISSITLTHFFLKSSAAPLKDAKSALHKGIIWLLTIVIIILCALFGRGTLDTFPLSRRTTVINDNPVINSLALNGPYHFYYAHKDLKEDSFSDLNTRKILNKAKLDNVEQLKAAAGFNIDNPLQQTTSDKGPTFAPPNVIFVLMEGWSSHIANAQGTDNQVLGEFAKHSIQDYFFKRVFSDKYGTNPTIESLLLNAPIGPITQSTANTHSFKLSNVLPFKDQGYSTLFLSGGNSSWRKHGQFWPRQGFDQYIGRATIEKHYNEIADNPWGVYDSLLFKYLQKQLIDKTPDKPLFSFVLTTNNHGPIRLPKNYRAPKLAPQDYGFDKNDQKAHESLTGFHFQTNALGGFLTWLKQSEFAQNTIVVATGDHILKGFANYSAIDQVYNRFAVATYLYTPKTYDQLQKSDELLAGSHKDLFPTLFELALSNTQYLAFGDSFMKKRNNPSYGKVDQGAFIFNSGISTNAKQQLPWKDKGSIQLTNQPKDLSYEQLQMVKQQHYREILQKYLLIEEAGQQ